MVLIFYEGLSVRGQWESMARKGVSTYEVNADGRDVALSVGVVGESEQQTRLSDTGVTDQKELEEVVVSVESLYERHVLRGSLSGRRRQGCC